jgi:hypothetical protein
MLVKFCWLTLAIIHFLPALAFFKPSLLTSLYGAQVGSVTHMLLQHRAALFLGIFILCIWALLKPESRQLAAIVVGISMITFLLLFAYNNMPANLQIIAIVDLVGLPLLFFVAWQDFSKSSAS